MMNDTDWAYLAGLIDGDGHIGMHAHNNGIRITVEISNTDLAALEKIKRKTGRGYILEKARNKKYLNAKDVWAWQITSFPDVEFILTAIVSYMVIKKEAAMLLLEYCMNRIKGTSFTEKEWALYKRMKELNKKGVG